MYVTIPKSKITKMAIVKTDCKQTLKQVVANQKCQYAINGGLYDMETHKVNPIPLRINGKTIATSSDGYWMLAWNIGSDIKMIHSTQMANYKYAIACSTFLKDGANTIFKYTEAQGGCRGRTGFGEDKTNVHLCVTTDSNGPLWPNGLRSTMKAKGCLDGIMLDSGGSSQIYNNGSYLYTGRPVAYWICIWTSETTKTASTTVSEDVPYDSPTRTLKYGCTGEDVSWLQWQLNKKNNAGLPITAGFYSLTKQAVIAYQKKVFPTDKSQWDGIVGAKTLAKLKAV